MNPRKHSRNIPYAMFDEGATPEEVSKARGLTMSTAKDYHRQWRRARGHDITNAHKGGRTIIEEQEFISEARKVFGGAKGHPIIDNFPSAGRSALEQKMAEQTQRASLQPEDPFALHVRPTHGHIPVQRDYDPAEAARLAA